MQYYRRKPLNLTSLSPAQLPTNPASLLDSRPRTLSPNLESQAPEILNPLKALGQPNPENSVKTAQMADPAALLQQAADILEQELLPSLSPAANPGTSLPLPGLSSKTLSPNLLAIHQFIDLFAQVIAKRPRTEGVMSPIKPAYDGNPLPLLKSPVVQPGEVAHFSFKVHNDSERPVKIQLYTTDLVSSAGDKILSSNIKLTPEHLFLLPDQVIEVVIQINVSIQAPSNTYFGQVIASDSDLAAAVRLIVQ